MKTNYGILLFCLSLFFMLFDCLTYGQTINFAGITWNVKSGYWGPGPNHWSGSTDNVWVDTDGILHLKITKVGSEWYCAEIYSQQSFCYGEYRFYVASNVELLDQNIVVGLFTYETDTREIDIEFSRWGDPAGDVGWYTVQPYSSSSSIHFPLNLGGDYSTHKFIWSSSGIFFQSYHGHYATLPSPDFLIKEWTYTGSNIPPAGEERLRMNFWLMSGLPPTNGLEAEVKIKAVFIPAQSTPPTGISAIPSVICSGESSVLTVSGGSAGTGAEWKWYAGGCGNGAAIGSGPSLTVYPESTTTYYVRAEGSCDSTTCANATVTVNPQIVANFSADKLTPQKNETVIFSDLTTGGATTWNWSFDRPGVVFVNSTTPTSRHPQVQFSDGGLYEVTLLASNSYCSDSEIKTGYIRAGTSGMWTGNNSSEWFTLSNWDNHLVPDGMVDAVILPSATFWPVFNGDLIIGVHCRSLTLSGPDSKITITGNLVIATNSSSWNPIPSGNVQGICPVGWHLPSNAEWTTLMDYLGGLMGAGGKMKEAGTAHWTAPNDGATNSSGFTALPAGSSWTGAVFNFLTENAYFWSSSEWSAIYVRSYSLYHGSTFASSGISTKSHGFSVRCIKD